MSTWTPAARIPGSHATAAGEFWRWSSDPTRLSHSTHAVSFAVACRAATTSSLYFGISVEVQMSGRHIPGGNRIRPPSREASSSRTPANRPPAAHHTRSYTPSSHSTCDISASLLPQRRTPGRTVPIQHPSPRHNPRCLLAYSSHRGTLQSRSNSSAAPDPHLPLPISTSAMTTTQLGWRADRCSCFEQTVLVGKVDVARILLFRVDPAVADDDPLHHEAG